MQHVRDPYSLNRDELLGRAPVNQIKVSPELRDHQEADNRQPTNLARGLESRWELGGSRGHRQIATTYNPAGVFLGAVVFIDIRPRVGGANGKEPKDPRFHGTQNPFAHYRAFM